MEKNGPHNKLFGVITGDIVGSSKIMEEQREQLMLSLKSAFETVNSIVPDIVHAPFEIYRGDSFQGVFSHPEKALHAAIVIRAGLRYMFKTKQLRHAIDARMAVGIGTIDYLPGNRASEGDGEAYRRSGPNLDKMRGYRRLLFRTPWPEIDAELDSACALLDVIVERWSAEQAQAILGQIKGLTQEKAAKELGISQPAVLSRLKTAGSWAIEKLCNRFETMIERRAAENEQ